MTTPTRVTSEDAFVLLLDPEFVRVEAGAVEYDLAAAGDAGVASFAGRVGVVVPEAGDYSAAQVTYGGGDVASGLAAAQSTADAAQSDAAQALADAAAAQSTADGAQADATAALGALATLDTDDVANASGVPGATATAALDALLGDVLLRATLDQLADETSARIAADNLLAPLASPALTGMPTSPTAAPGTNTTQVGTTAFVTAAVAVEAAARAAADALLAPLASPAFSGTPTAPTASLGSSSTQVATTAFVVDTVDTATSPLAPKASPAFTGNPTAPTPATSDNDTSVATSAMVQAVAALCLKAFNTGGAVSGAKAWYGTATTDASGDWTANISSAGFSASPVVLLAAELNTTTVTDQVWATLRTKSSTSLAGTAIRGVVLAVLGATLRRAASGATVHVLAIGT